MPAPSANSRADRRLRSARNRPPTTTSTTARTQSTTTTSAGHGGEDEVVSDAVPTNTVTPARQSTIAVIAGLGILARFIRVPSSTVITRASAPIGWTTAIGAKTRLTSCRTTATTR